MDDRHPHIFHRHGHEKAVSPKARPKKSKGARGTGKQKEKKITHIPSKEPCFKKHKLRLYKSPSFQGFSPFVQLLYTLPAKLDMPVVERNISIVDSSPQAANPRLEKTMNSRSPDIQEINEDIRQTHKIYYHFQNCGTVYMPVNSFNARGVRMENCGNNVPQVTCSLSFPPYVHFCSHLYHVIQITVQRLLTMRKFYTHNLMQSPVVCCALALSAI